MRADLIFLGRTRLCEAAEAQKKALAGIIRGSGDPVIFVGEHEPVYTVGRAGVNRKAPEGDPARYPNVNDRSIEVVELDRGGDVTWHGPGQAVVYPVLPLKRLGLSLVGYLRALERAGIDALARHGVETYVREGLTGVWVLAPDGGHAKIGFIGVGCRRWVTYHGLCINVACDLAPFDTIVPCGIEGVRVTRLADLAGQPPTPEELGREVARALAKAVGLRLTESVEARRR